MRAKTLVAVLFAASLAAAPAAVLAKGPGGGGKGGASAPSRGHVERGQLDRDRDRMQDRIHAPDKARLGENRIYGSGLMSDAEKKAYQKRLNNAKTIQEREQIEAQHRHEMQIRAKNQNAELDDNGQLVRKNR